MIKSRPEQEADPIWRSVTSMVGRGVPGRLANRPSLTYALHKYGPGSSGVEIGVADGSLSQIIIEDMQPRSLYLVDPWLLYPDFAQELIDVGFVGEQYKEWFTQECHDRVYNSVVERFKNNNKVHIIRDMSENAASLVPDGTLDWAYVDGSHKEKYVYKDLVSWWPKVRAGGMLCGHDFTFPGIPPALERFSMEMNLVVWPYGGDWWINK